MWSYDPSLMVAADAGKYPGSTVGLRMQIRFVIQDTNPARPLLQDEEIDYLQGTEANQYMAAAFACDILVARSGALSSKAVGPLRLTYDPKFYESLSATLKARGMLHQVPYVGGISIADKLGQQDNPDWVPTRVFRGIFDNPRANQPAAGEDATPTSVGFPGAF